MMENILITGTSSDMAQALIKSIIELNLFKNIYACARNVQNLDHGYKNVNFFELNICDENSFNNFDKEIEGVKFDAVVNFAGIAVTSPVVKLPDDELQKQLDVSVIGFSRLLRHIYTHLHSKSRVINISSMASFGIFPFISPYCLSKASADILLNAFEIETGICAISIKPGVVSTKFWEYSVEMNRNNFKNFTGEFEDTGKFLLDNAIKNSNKGVNPEAVAKVILKAITSKHPKASYLVGYDSVFASFSKFLPKRVLNKLISTILQKRVRKFIKNGK